MIDRFSQRELAGLGAALGLAILVGFGTGAVLMDGTSPTGAVSGGEAVSASTVKSNVQSFMDQRIAAQEQQMAQIAEQRPNMSADDFSMDATVTDVSASEYGGLFAVSIAVTQSSPNPQTGEVEEREQTQTLYVTQDGQYMFSQPTALSGQQATAPSSQ